MENEEKYIREKVGQKNPFTVPEGYFDQLTSQVMSQLPERRQKSRVVQLRKWFYAAACVAAVAVMGLTYHFHQQADDPDDGHLFIGSGAKEILTREV